MFEIEKFKISDEQIQEQLAEAEQQLTEVKVLSAKLKAQQEKITADTEKLSPKAKSVLRYFRSPADIIVFAVLNGDGEFKLQITGYTKDMCRKTSDQEQKVNGWYNNLIEIIGEHPESEEAIARLDRMKKIMLGSK